MVRQDSQVVRALASLTDTSPVRIAEYARRKKPNEEQTFNDDERESAEALGWKLLRENKSSLRFEKPRTPKEQLSNEFWRLLYELGYPVLNLGQEFEIGIFKKEDIISKEIVDVFAYDDHTIIVARCRAFETRTKKHLQEDIAEFSSSQRAIANSVRRHFAGQTDKKIIWMFITKNVEWYDADIERAFKQNIKIITERDLPYFKEIAKRVGKSARFQFHAEFLKGQKTDSLEKVIFAMRTKLGKNRVYTFFTSPHNILPISFVNHRDLRDPIAAPSYQRLVQKNRLKQIAEFVSDGGLFPNSIILNLKGTIRFDPLSPESEGVTPGRLTLPNTYKSAWIIDGQHRLYGYAEASEQDKNAILPFIAFEKISIVEETKLFGEINSKQKRVEKRLLDEITGEIKLESSNKKEQIRAIASRTFDLMRDDDDGPLGGKITGVELKISEQSVLTIPYLVDAVVRANLIGSVSKKDKESKFIEGSINWKSPREGIDRLREFLSEYFNLFKISNPQRWEAGPSGKLTNNPTIAGLIRFSDDIVKFTASENDFDAGNLHPKILVEKIEPYLEPVLEFIRDGLYQASLSRTHAG